MKVYISGPIETDEWYMNHFEDAEKGLKEAGYEVVNPAAEDEETTADTYKEWIDRDLALLSECDAIYMLRNWQQSRGARLEHQYAKITKMWIAYQ